MIRPALLVGLLAGLVAAAAATAHAGELTYVGFTGDADVGIADDRPYTATVNAGGPDLLVNGVLFRAMDGNNAGNGVSGAVLAFPQPTGVNTHHGQRDSYHAHGAVARLLDTFLFAATPRSTAVVVLQPQSLEPGVTYLTRLYLRSWDHGASRLVELSFDEGGGAPVSTGVINLDRPSTIKGAGFAADTQAYSINYRFTAQPGRGLTITLTPQGGDNFHCYALSNEAVTPAARP